MVMDGPQGREQQQAARYLGRGCYSVTPPPPQQGQACQGHNIRKASALYGNAQRGEYAAADCARQHDMAPTTIGLGWANSIAASMRRARSLVLALGLFLWQNAPEVAAEEDRTQNGRMDMGRIICHYKFTACVSLTSTRPQTIIVI
ncbi:unnamed protein product [Amoebophrya sp. A25]|nr:unnamed protein product [Amoebophrya sp. A25]|eukprot:GSA25T00016111001.1